MRPVRSLWRAFALLWQLELVMTRIWARPFTAALRHMRSMGRSLAMRRAAWSVPVGLAAVVTGYLAWGAWVSARDPSWLYRDNEWWRAWLRPGGDGVLLIFAALWLASTLAYWWPRRRQLPDVGLVVIAAMVVVGVVLGTASFAPCHGNQSQIAVVAWVLELFVGSLEPRYGQGTSCPGHLPLALQIGRSVALCATFIGAIAAAAVLWRQPVARLRARLVKDASILTGLDAMTIALVRELVATGRPSRVVVIEPDRGHPLLEAAQSTEAQIIIADPRSPQVLQPLLRGLRGPQLRHLFALRLEAAENEAILNAAQQVLAHTRADPERPPHLRARLEDPRHADVWRSRRVGVSSLWFEDVLSPNESTARTLVGRIAHAGAQQVLLCGDNSLALALLIELGRRAWEHKNLAAAAGVGAAGHQGGGEPTGMTEAGGPPDRVILLDVRATDLRREFLASSSPPIANALSAVHASPGAWRRQLLATLDGMTPQQAAETAVVITDTPSDASLHEAGRVARLHPETTVFILTSDGAGVTGTAFDRLWPFQRTLLVDGHVPEDSWTRIARYWHETYRLAHPADSADKKWLTRRPWEELEEFIRQDNILQLRSIMTTVAELGRLWVPVRAVVPGSFVELTETELRRVAVQEHARWVARRRQAGWQVPAEGEPDDDSRHVNRHLRPWDDLPAEAREGAADQVQSQLAQLEVVGFLPVLPPGGPPGAATFLRIGAVRAERLPVDYDSPPPGGGLGVSAGHWLVTDNFGNQQTLRDEDFHSSHTPLGGDRWQRVGVIRAWRVSEATAVRTLAGRAMAQPGYWIAQGPHGERWPVNDDHFARGYQPIGR